MKATGVVRRIDDLGRIVIPKEIRRTMQMKEGDAVEIFTQQDNEIVLKKYSMMKSISRISQKYADTLYKVSGLNCVICDESKVIAYAGQGKKEFLNKKITSDAEDIESSRRPYFKQFPNEKALYLFENSELATIGVTPIIAEGDCAGVIAVLDNDKRTLSDSRKKLLILTSNLLADNLRF